MKALTYGAFLTITLQQIAAGIPAQSDGSDGPFHPGGNITINLADEAPDGVLNYTTINIPQNVTVRFSSNPSNTPVFMAATGDVVVEGSIAVSAGSGWNPGGHSGGLKGHGAQDGTPGAGPVAGNPGFYLGDHIVGAAGGGAGMADGGQAATAWTATPRGAGGPLVLRPNLTPGHSGGDGSGGGGGGGATHWGPIQGAMAEQVPARCKFRPPAT